MVNVYLLEYIKSIRMLPYQEKQTFFTWWLSGLLFLIFAAGVYMGWNNGEATSKTQSFWGGAGWGLVITAVIFILIFSTQLRTSIDHKGIQIRFFPYMPKAKHWKWEDIDEVYVRKYTFWEYGGWGYRLGNSGTAYNTKGFYGIQMVLKNGKKRVLIGTQNPEEMQRVLASFKATLHNEN